MDLGSLGVVLVVVALLVSLYVYRLQSKSGELLRAAVECIAKEVGAARTEAAEREGVKTATQRAAARKAAMYREYILSHDGISPGIMAGTEALPPDWVADWARHRPA